MIGSADAAERKDGGASHTALLDLLSGAGNSALSAISRLLDDAAFSVAVFERSDEIRVAYLNRSAAAHAVVAPEVAIGRPVQEVFPQVEPQFIGQLLDDSSNQLSAMNLRGLMPGGAAWSIDAVALGHERLLITAEQFGQAVSSRQRLEALLASMDAIWRTADFKSMAPQVVEQASRLFMNVDIGLYELNSNPPPGLVALAANSGWMLGPRSVIEDHPVALRVATEGEVIEVILAGTDVADGAEEAQLARARAMRAIPLVTSDGENEGRRSFGVLLFLNKTGAPFTEDERQLMNEFAKLVALAAQRAAFLSDARGSAERLRLTLDLAMALASSQSPRDVIQLLLDRTLAAVDADRATLSRIEGNELTIEATNAKAGDLTWVGRQYGIDWVHRQPLVRQALETQRPVLGGQLDVAEAAPEFREALTASHRTAIVPLTLNGHPGGLLVASRRSDVPFGDAEVSTLELMGNAAMLALRNARLLEDLKAANIAKSEFLDHAAHELRTPVTVIKGYTSLLQAEALDGPDQMGALDIIQDKAAELARVVDSLLLASRSQIQSQVVEVSRFDAVTTVRRAIERAVPYAQLCGGEIGSSLPSGEVAASGNPASVGRILDNLLTNAIAYCDEAPQVEVRLTASDEEVDIEVEDRGRGIPSTHHVSVFDAFVRVDGNSPKSTSGAGLGLYIARNLAKSMGGELSLVRSEPGGGSVFRLRLKRSGEV